MSINLYAQDIIRGRLTLEEEDASPSGTYWKIKVSNNTLTENSDYSASLDTSGSGSVSDAIYGVGWNGDTTIAPSKNAVYDKIETLGGGHDAVTLDVNADTLLSLSTQALGLDTQTANTIFSGPASGAAAVPTFRLLVDADVPDTITLTNITQITTKSHTSLSDIGTNTHAQLDTFKDTTVPATYAPLASPTFTGTVTIPTPFTLGAVSVLPTGTELNYVDGVTSAIQTQIDSKQGTLTNSAGLAAALSDETGSGAAVFGTSPTFLTDITFPALSIEAGAYGAATIDGDDIASGIAGRSLTLTAASPDTLDADAELYTDCKTLYLEDPVAADDLLTIWVAPVACTITKLHYESDQTVVFDLQIDDGTPAAVNGSDITCTTFATDSALAGDTTMAAGDRLDLAITSVSGTPTWFSVSFEYTKDD